MTTTGRATGRSGADEEDGRKTARGRSWVPALLERVRGSLFVVPTAYAVAGVLFAVLTLLLDEQTTGELSIPLVVATTAESARSVLSTVAAATMAFAGIAISVTLVVFQMASSQYSPRVVHGIFRDKANKRTIGIVVGTFTYCLVVLRSVHGPLESGGDAVVPTFSVSVAVVLGVVTVLAVVGFIDHNARWMDVSHLLQDLTDTTRSHAADHWWPDDAVTDDDQAPDRPAATVAADRDGWIQHLDVERLLELVPDDGTVLVECAPGAYVGRGQPLARVWPADAAEPDPDPESTAARIRAAVVTGSVRTVTQDPSYAVRQMADIALKALSPGINDPTTAQEALLHLGESVRAVFDAGIAPRALRAPGGGRLLVEVASGPDLVELAFSEIRRAAAPHPAVAARLLDVLDGVAAGVAPDPEGLAVHRALRRQAELTVADAIRAGVGGADLQVLRARLGTMSS